MRNQTNETCPLCPNHCPAANLKCGKGHAHFRTDRQTTENCPPHRQYSGGLSGWKNEPFAAAPSKESLPYLLFHSSHYLHESLQARAIEAKNRLFACLSDAEQNQLKTLLQKLLSYWQPHKRETE